MLTLLACAPPGSPCSCEDAAKSPLAHEFAYRAGICKGAPKELGPAQVTTTCLDAIHAEYNEGGAFNGAEPENFNASTAGRYPVFDGVSHVRLPAGVVVERWSCQQENACGDCDPQRPQQCSDERGFAYLWVPPGATDTTARLLYIHGGSWLYGSPETASYAPFVAKIARTTGMAVLAIDYTLAPVGNFSRILGQVGAATHWLATHSPLVVLRDGWAAAGHGVDDAPPLFIAGDSSGGGTATSALLAQASAAGLPNAAGARLSGGVLYSPWLNLACDTPSYVSQAYKREDIDPSRERVIERCDVPGLNASQRVVTVNVGGDVAFTGYPHTLSASFAANGATYAGDASTLRDPIASPMRAGAALLGSLPPLQVHVGLGEVLVAENVIFATKTAAAGGAVELHSYDAMWHVFAMYYEGCEHPDVKPLLFADSALNLTATFLRDLDAKDGALRWRTNGAPLSLTHYEYPRGTDTAMEAYHSLRRDVGSDCEV